VLSVPEHGRRTYLALVASLLAIGVGAWGGELVGLGQVGGFATLWLLLMCAVLLPSSAPMVATHSAVRHSVAGSLRAWAGTTAFVTGYLAAWTAAGTVAYVVESAPNHLAEDRWVDAVVLAVAAAYELTPFKDRWLAQCRVPLSFTMLSWREGASGALDMGARYGLLCVGCCFTLATALIALGFASPGWTALVGGLIALEKLSPSRFVATRISALVLAVLAVAMAAGLFGS
jgi:predicted metal-binding membrane protein